MSNYILTSDWGASGNNNGVTMPHGPDGFCIHHAAGFSLDHMVTTWLRAETSAHYGIKDNEVRQFVEDRRGAWHCGNYWGNNRLISIECVNSGGASQGWPVSEKTVDTLVEFLADKCREYEIPELVVGLNLYGHKDFYATFCPGVLYPRLGEIADRVNNILHGNDVVETNDAVGGIEVTPEEFWNYQYKGSTMAERLYLSNWMDYNTDDPTGRGITMNNHDHIKYIAQKQQTMYERLENVENLLKTISEKLEEKDKVDVTLPEPEETENAD